MSYLSRDELSPLNVPNNGRPQAHSGQLVQSFAIVAALQRKQDRISFLP